jgi:glycosidase
MFSLLMLGLGLFGMHSCKPVGTGQQSSAGMAVSATETQIVVAMQRMELRFDKRTGRWLSAVDPRDGTLLLDSGSYVAPVMLTVGGRTTVTRGQQQVWSILDAESVGGATRVVDWQTEQRGDSTWFELETVQGEWRIWQDFGFNSFDDFLQRRIRVRWEGEGEQLLRWVDLRTPSITKLDETTLSAPGFGFLYQPADQIPMGKWAALPEVPGIDAPAWRLGILSIYANGRTVVVWPYDANIPAIMLVHRARWGAWIEQRMLAASRLQSGQEIKAGTQFIRLHQGPIMTSMNHFHKFWRDVGVHIQDSTSSWGKDARIYEVQVGHMRNPQASAKPYETVADLTHDLPRIKNMGFNIVQFMPHMPFPSYSVHDYFDINVQYGPEAEVREMITQAHALGLKVLLDVVLHGVTDKTLNERAIFAKSPLVAEHPNWFSHNEYGGVAMTYTWALDHRNPEVQQYMVKVFNFYVEKLKADGFRVDAVTWNCFPNWAKHLGRPAYSSLYGTASMMDLVRRESHKLDPELVFYNEAAGPLYYRAFDLSYNYDEQWLYSAILSGRKEQPSRGWAEPGLTAQDLGEWLEMRRRAMPQGLIRVHHVDSHDAYFGNGSRYRREVLGVEATRMLFALTSFIDGGIMSFVGAEAGSEEYYRKVLSIRESIPALKNGTCEYLTVTSENERVFTPLRRYGKEWALPVISFSKEPIDTWISLKPIALDPVKVYTLHEAFSGREKKGTGKDFASIQVKLAPLEAQVWTVTEGGKPL